MRHLLHKKGRSAAFFMQSFT